jgi:hypothetical protein
MIKFSENMKLSFYGRLSCICRRSPIGEEEKKRKNYNFHIRFSPLYRCTRARTTETKVPFIWCVNKLQFFLSPFGYKHTLYIANFHSGLNRNRIGRQKEEAEELKCDMSSKVPFCSAYFETEKGRMKEQKKTQKFPEKSIFEFVCQSLAPLFCQMQCW